MIRLLIERAIELIERAIDWIYDFAYVHDAPREILRLIKPRTGLW